MKVEVGYAYYEGNAQVWDTLYVPIRRAVEEEEELGPAAVAHLAQEAALLMLEQRDDPDPIVGTFLIGVDKDCVVECPQCGGWQVHVVDVEYAQDGELVTLDEPVLIDEEGEWMLPDKFHDEKGYTIVDKQWAVCDQCGHRDRAFEFVRE